MKSNQIVKFNGVVGRAIKSEYECKGEFLFLPAGYGRYYESELEIITDETIQEATHEDKLEWIKNDFACGEVLKIECVGMYQIVVGKRDNEEVLYTPYINYNSISTSYMSLDAALVGVVGYKYEGGNGNAAMYFQRMVGLE